MTNWSVINTLIFWTVYFLGCAVSFIYGIRTIKKEDGKVEPVEFFILALLSLLSWICAFAILSGNKFEDKDCGDEEW